MSFARDLTLSNTNFPKKKKIFEGFATIFTLKNTFTLRVVCALGRNTQQPDVFRVEFLEVR
jgi:hypothetical protein